jgi:hypothetical protein
VNVRIKILRHVEVDDVRDAVHIDSTRSDIGGDEDTVLPVAETCQSSFALPLGEVSVQRRGSMPRIFKLLRDPARGMLHLGEDDDHRLRVTFQPTVKELVLIRLINSEEPVRDLRDGALRGDTDGLWIGQQILRQFLDFGRHSRRKEHRLTLFRKRLHDLANDRQKSHVEHPIGLI